MARRPRSLAAAQTAATPRESRLESPRVRLVALVAVALLGLAVRLRSLPALLFDGHVHLLSGDSHYHLRRMALAARDGLAMPDFDAWTHAPKGLHLLWPPLFDAAGGLVARILGAGPQDVDGVAMAGIAVALVCTTLTFAMAARLGGTLAGVAAGLVIIAMLGHDNYTHAGKVDHHVLEPLLTFTALAWMLRAAQAPALRPRLLWAGLSAIALALALESWPSTALSILLLAGCGGVLVLAAGDDLDLRRRFATAAVTVLGLAGVIGLPLAWLSPLGRAGVVDAVALSWFQPILLLICAAAVSTIAVAVRPGLPGKAVAVLGGAAVFALALFLWPAGRASLLGGSEFVSGAGFVVLINESGGVLRNGAAESLRFFSLFSALIPLLLFWSALSHSKRANGPLLVVAAALLATSVLAWQQVRFVMLLAVPLAVLVGAGFSALFAAARRRSGVGAWLVGLAFVGLLVPSAQATYDKALPLGRRVSVWKALRWMAASTPSAGDAWQPDTLPSYSVMAPWAFGHEVLAIGLRANVASPFIQPHETEGLESSVRFALTSDPALAEQLMERHNARYVLSAPLALAATHAYALALNEPPERYVVGDDANGRTLTPEGTESSAVALHQRNGSAERRDEKSWNFLRLVRSEDNGHAKIFEKVAGAQLRGRGGRANTSVTLEVDLEVEGQQRRWLSHTRADENGNFGFRVPYATDVQGKGNVRGTATLVRGIGVVKRVAIPESAVVDGAEVSIDMQTGHGN